MTDCSTSGATMIAHRWVERWHKTVTTARGAVETVGSVCADCGATSQREEDRPSHVGGRRRTSGSAINR
jgi:hypothetical protein